MYTFVARHILAPVLELSRGTNALKCLKELEESQWWPKDRILELQNQRLSQLLKHTYERVPYYRRIFDERDIKPADITCSEDLIKLPVLNKRLIRANFTDIVARDFPQREVITSYTGGSTGEPLMFYRTKDERFNWAFAALQRAFQWAGYEIGDKTVLIGAGQHIREPSTSAKITRVLRFFFERFTYFDVVEFSANVPLFAEQIQAFQPKFIRGFPSAIYLLARFIEKEGGYKVRPNAIITGAEQVYEHQRKLFQMVFQCETYSGYNTNEVHGIAAECPAHSGYHISSENLIVEIVDDEGNPVPTGEDGRILITNLHNLVMPFIRYDIGDLGALARGPCPCGRGLPLLSRLSGRTVDVVLTSNGKAIPGIGLPFSPLAHLNVEQFQIVQESYNTIVVKLVLQEKHSISRDELRQEVIRMYRAVLGDETDIIVEFVDHIPVTNTGKRRFVISKVSQELP